MNITVAIIGRPNVGKSTLFNRLAGKKLALVADTPGVTRHRREAEGRISDLEFRVVDTAGLDEALVSEVEQGMRDQTERALDEAAVVMFVIDARTGITPIDRHFAAWLRERDRTSPCRERGYQDVSHPGDAGYIKKIHTHI